MLNEAIRSERGVATLEFALILPVLVAICLSLFELTMRFNVADEVKRYGFQVGDFLSRADTLTDTEIDNIFAVADRVMPTVDWTAATLSMGVASVGFDADGDPVLLWEELRGPEEVRPDIESVRGLAEPGTSVLVATTRLRTPTLFKVFGVENMMIETSTHLKPRATRAIGLNGSLTAPGIAVEGYGDV